MKSLRRALRPDSVLLPLVREGLGGLIVTDKIYIADVMRAQFSDSLNLDEAFRVGHDQNNRWDYLLGHNLTGMVIGLEPHSARQDEVSTVIKKKRAAMDHLRPHLREGAFIHAWFWVASGPVFFADTERTRLRLAQEGINFVGKQLLPKHVNSVHRGK